MRPFQAVAVLAVLGALGASAPAEDVPKAPWSLDFTHAPLELITVSYKDGTSAPAYYMVFRLENKRTVDAPLSLQFRAVVGADPKKQQTLLALPNSDAEEWVRRITRADDLRNVQELNAGGKGVLKPGESVRGIAVFGPFDREWDVAVVQVSGLDPRVLQARVRRYANGSFTLAHRAWNERNRLVVEKTSKDETWREFSAVVSFETRWVMTYVREGDEYAPNVDPVVLETERWVVAETPAPKIEMEITLPFGKP